MRRIREADRSQLHFVNFGQTDIDQQNLVNGVPFLGRPFGWIGPYNNANHSASPNKGQVVTIASIVDGTSNTILVSEMVVGKERTSVASPGGPTPRGSRRSLRRIPRSRMRSTQRPRAAVPPSTGC